MYHEAQAQLHNPQELPEAVRGKKQRTLRRESDNLQNKIDKTKNLFQKIFIFNQKAKCIQLRRSNADGPDSDP